MQRCSRLLSTLPLTSSSTRCSVAAAAGSQFPTKGCHLSTVCTSPLRGSTSSFAYSNTTLSSLARFRPLPSRGTGEPPAISSRNTSAGRLAHTTSSSKWLARQSSDRFTREAKVANLKSRAAFKLLQINERYPIFRPGMTVVDLGYAPGSWSQVAIDLVKPGVGRVVGVDMIPVQPPKGVNGMQGDFLNPEVQARVREFLQDENRGKMRRNSLDDDLNTVEPHETTLTDREQALAELENAASEHEESVDGLGMGKKCVDVVLSDMSAPWEITSGLFKNSISDPYRRMMNTTGNKFKDHAGSMDLCRAALYFSYENLKVGGSFVCKFYQGAEDKILEKQLKGLFGKVHREKPESSRSESRESFFVCLKRLANADRHKIFSEI